MPPYTAPKTGQVRPGLQVHELKDDGRAVCGNSRREPMVNLGPGTVNCESCIRDTDHVSLVNIWDEVPDWGGVGARRLIRGGSGLGASVWEIRPGGDYWRHFHHASDELLIVLRGRPTVGTRDGTRQLNEGDALPLPHGRSGDRTIANETADVVRFLMISTNLDPDVAEYPDSGKVGIWVGERGTFFRAADAVEHAGPE